MGPHDITGKTRVLGILAWPTDHVKAPPAINRIAAARGRDAVMVPIAVRPENFAEMVGALRHMENLDGCIVTVPHKQSILPLCDRLTDQARAVGAVNILRRHADGALEGGQLDGLGFVNGLRAQGIDPTGKRVYLAGAGGAACAVAFALAGAGVECLTLANRSRDKVEAVRDRLLAFRPGLPVTIGGADPTGHDVVVNGTILGMHAGDALPLDTAGLSADMVVAEVIMDPETTPLLKAAEAAGCTVHRGNHMLDHQLQLMADFMGL